MFGPKHGNEVCGAEATDGARSRAEGQRFHEMMCFHRRGIKASRVYWRLSKRLFDSEDPNQFPDPSSCNCTLKICCHRCSVTTKPEETFQVNTSDFKHLSAAGWRWDERPTATSTPPAAVAKDPLPSFIHSVKEQSAQWLLHLWKFEVVVLAFCKRETKREEWWSGRGREGR